MKRYLIKAFYAVCVIVIIGGLFNIHRNLTTKTVKQSIPLISNPSLPVKNNIAYKNASEFDKAQLVDLTNKDREQAGLSPLVLTDSLNKSAQDKCNHMIANNYFAHVAPDGTQPWSFIQKYTTYSSAGENLAVSVFDANSVNTAFMNSPTHKANIDSANFTNIGVATCDLPSHGVVVVEHFDSPLLRSSIQLPPCLMYNPSGESQLPGIDCI